MVGSHLAGRLRTAGVRVVALQRAASDTAYLRGIGCEIVEGDVRESPETLAAKVSGTDVVVHAAALVYSGGSWPEIRGVTVGGTQNVVRACALAGAGHTVQVSSIAVYGSTGQVGHEGVALDSPLRPGDLYARSKRESERVAREVGREEGVIVTAVRPSAVYGERDRLFAPKIGRLAQLPWIPMLGSGANRLPVVYAGNVAAAIVTILAGRGVGGTFNLSEDEPLTQRDLLGGFARGLGREPRFVSVPSALVRAGANFSSWVGTGFPGMKGLSLQRVARLGLGNNPYPADHAREVLNWTDHIKHEEALRRTAQWWVKSRLPPQ